MIKLFNLDLHISVIADVKNILKTIFQENISITNWSISGHNWVLNQETAIVEVINQKTWQNIDKEIIEKIYQHYKDYLSTFDGFIVTHTPVFSLLYEKFNKPIFVVNSCRYENPFCFNFNIDMRNYFNKKLYEMKEKGHLTIISNNLADQEYLKLGANVDSFYLPSLCLYTNSSYSPKIKGFVIFDNNFIIPKMSRTIYKQQLGHNYKWETLYSFLAIIHIPYEISTMSIFEQYSANVPLFFPLKIF